MLLLILMVKKLLECLTKKNCKRQIKQNLELKKYLKEKVINYMSNGKVMIIHLIVELIKKILLYKMGYFAESYTYSETKIKFEFRFV